jgi:rhodanese-related sulfurtransferase
MKPITKQRIEKLQLQDTIVKLVDIRSATEFEKMHIPGAVNIPAETLEHNLSQFAAGDTIVCICNKGHERSQNAAEAATAAGFSNVYYLEGGILGWFAE